MNITSFCIGILIDLMSLARLIFATDGLDDVMRSRKSADCLRKSLCHVVREFDNLFQTVLVDTIRFSPPATATLTPRPPPPDTYNRRHLHSARSSPPHTGALAPPLRPPVTTTHTTPHTRHHARTTHTTLHTTATTHHTTPHTTRQHNTPSHHTLTQSTTSHTNPHTTPHTTPLLSPDLTPHAAIIPHTAPHTHHHTPPHTTPPTTTPHTHLPPPHTARHSPSLTTIHHHSPPPSHHYSKPAPVPHHPHTHSHRHAHTYTHVLTQERVSGEICFQCYAVFSYPALYCEIQRLLTPPAQKEAVLIWLRVLESFLSEGIPNGHTIPWSHLLSPSIGRRMNHHSLSFRCFISITPMAGTQQTRQHRLFSFPEFLIRPSSS
jgi:hypothetical protein